MIVLSPVHPLKALLSIVLSDAGNVTEPRALQFWKAAFPIFSTLLPRVRTAIFGQPSKEFEPTPVTRSPSLTEVSSEQP